MSDHHHHHRADLKPRSITCTHCGGLIELAGESRTAASRQDLLARLSAAQQRVLAYLLAGLTEPQIAEKIHRSRHTVHDHTKAIYAALGVTRRVQLVNLLSGIDAESIMRGAEHAKA